MVPFDRTARHSSSLFSTGYDMSLVVLDELKRLPRNGMVGMDLITAAEVRGVIAL
jgi:hypothetical protein